MYKDAQGNPIFRPPVFAKADEDGTLRWYSRFEIFGEVGNETRNYERVFGPFDTEEDAETNYGEIQRMLRTVFKEGVDEEE